MKPKFNNFLRKSICLSTLFCISLLTIQIYPTQAIATEAGIELYQYKVVLNPSDPKAKLNDFGARYYFGENLYHLGDFSMGVEGGIRARPIAPIKKSEARLRGLDIMGTASYDFNRHLQVYGKFGLTYEKLSAFIPNGASRNYETTRNTTPELKIGGKLKFNHLGVGVSVNKALFEENRVKNLNKPYKNNENIYSALTVSWDF